jgi:hypothetical protein
LKENRQLRQLVNLNQRLTHTAINAGNLSGVAASGQRSRDGGIFAFWDKHNGLTGEARRLAERLEIHHTPKHGSWLNIVEIELSALSGQCLSRRLPDLGTMRSEVSAWLKHRNTRGAPIHWRFTTDDARIKLLRLYPKL